MEKVIKIFVLILFLDSSLSYGMSKVSNLFKSETLEQKLINNIKKADIDQVKSLLKKGANPNYQDELGKTALMYAAEKGYLEIVTDLLKYGALINILDNKNENVFIKVKNQVAKILSREITKNEEEVFESLPDQFAGGLMEVMFINRQELYEKILQLLKSTIEKRVEKRNKQIKNTLNNKDFDIPDVLQSIILEYLKEQEYSEVLGSRENYDLEEEQKKTNESSCLIS